MLSRVRGGMLGGGGGLCGDGDGVDEVSLPLLAREEGGGKSLNVYAVPSM